MSALNQTKLTVGLAMLAEARQGEFDTAGCGRPSKNGPRRAQDGDAEEASHLHLHPLRCFRCFCFSNVPSSIFRWSRALVNKLLGNVAASPDEVKFRKLRSSNPKINSMLATRGIRAIFIGAGFVEEGEFLVLPDAAPIDGVQAALAGLQAQAEERAAAASAEKAGMISARKEEQEKENEERKRMKSGIEDDFAARKEPGWKAKAAGVKDGRSITSCADIGVGTGGGG